MTNLNSTIKELFKKSFRWLPSFSN
jgi:hypothetical protein